ncbi:MAG: hypothetical protein MZW92_43705, partial [Comamonadaceae bacterium]|nr:hypothetical protein [Comamonadaceae bacterium]
RYRRIAGQGQDHREVPRPRLQGSGLLSAMSALCPASRARLTSSNDFEPKYAVLPESKKHIEAIKQGLEESRSPAAGD